jgi:hypothetical protein
MYDDLFLAWAAGFFDGEGCVIVEISREKKCRHGFRTSLHATVTQTSLPCLHLFLEKFGGSINTTDYRTPNGRRWAVQYVWVVRNELAVEFLRAIYPYAVVKKTQIEAALEYPLRAANGRKYGSSSNPIPDEVQERRVAIAHQLREIRAAMKVEAKPAKEKFGA